MGQDYPQQAVHRLISSPLTARQLIRYHFCRELDRILQVITSSSAIESEAFERLPLPVISVWTPSVRESR